MSTQYHRATTVTTTSNFTLLNIKSQTVGRGSKWVSKLGGNVGKIAHPRGGRGIHSPNLKSYLIPICCFCAGEGVSVLVIPRAYEVPIL